MQAYGASFARVYNLRWTGFSRSVGPKLLDFYQSTAFGNSNSTLLDLACGTGQLARLALERGFLVTGIDLSDAMLEYARKNNIDYVAAGQTEFIQADAADFSIRRPVGLVVSTFDALNHLESFEKLESCFRCVFASLLDGGMFIFDLNTRLGLTRWSSISVEDTEEIMLVNRGIFDEANQRAITRISGFLRNENGLYERFEETAYNLAFNLDAVREALIKTGWGEVTIANINDLGMPLEEPEKEGRVFFVARK